jgi:hypothetical protein
MHTSSSLSYSLGELEIELSSIFGTRGVMKGWRWGGGEISPSSSSNFLFPLHDQKIPFIIYCRRKNPIRVKNGGSFLFTQMKKGGGEK